jgi:hypothetical protein
MERNHLFVHGDHTCSCIRIEYSINKSKQNTKML